MCWNNSVPSADGSPRQWSRKPEPSDSKFYRERVLAGNCTRYAVMEIRHHTVHANGIRQHYLDAGHGPPVVLLHGFPETNYARRLQIPALATRYRVIAPDLRGYGETNEPTSG